jgi:hypothetical protein
MRFLKKLSTRNHPHEVSIRLDAGHPCALHGVVGGLPLFPGAAKS